MRHTYTKTFWDKHYQKTEKFQEPSSFAKFCEPYITDSFVELGCGDGRDLYYLNRKTPGYGVDRSANDDVMIIQQSVEQFIKQNPCPPFVYTRFFWHSIPYDTQIKILNWVTGTLFIEARTTNDNPKNLFGKHQRYLVNVDQLRESLLKRKFTIDHFEVGTGLSPYMGEDPHLVRIIAHKA